MSAITLHFAPDSCSRVPLIALETIGVPYRLEVVTFKTDQHRSPEYLAINPKGKVPTLVVDGESLTENVAILTWLSARFPEAKLLPEFDDSIKRARVISDLAFCASGLHPIVTRLRIPQLFCDSVEGARRVFELAELAMRPNFDILERRFATQKWWYGDQWSIVDAYINWVWFRVSGTRFDGSAFTNLARHNREMIERPAIARALAISANVSEDLKTRGLAMNFIDP